MNPIVLVVGPPAVGKSSASRALAAQFPRSIHIPVDTLRDMVVSGLALPSATWGADLIAQIDLARAAAVQMALSYQGAGFAVVVDDFVDPLWLAAYGALDGHPGVQRVLLRPDQAEAHRRNLQRAGESPERHYIDEDIRIVYQQLALGEGRLERAGYVAIDTTALSVEETVAEMLRIVRA
jgi:AAA domain